MDNANERVGPSWAVAQLVLVSLSQALKKAITQYMAIYSHCHTEAGNYISCIHQITVQHSECSLVEPDLLNYLLYYGWHFCTCTPYTIMHELARIWRHTP